MLKPKSKAKAKARGRPKEYVITKNKLIPTNEPRPPKQDDMPQPREEET